MATKRVHNRGIQSGRWFALLRGPAALPVIFHSKKAAQENRDDDEYLVEVFVVPAAPSASWKAEAAAAKRPTPKRSASRPRLPDTAKRRRGSR